MWQFTHSPPVRVVAKNFVVAVGDGIYGGRIRRAGAVALQTEKISRQLCFHRVDIVAIHAAHALMKHPAAHECRHLVVLIANLTVGIKQIRIIHDGQEIVIKKFLARHRVACDFRAARMAAGADVKIILARHFF